MTARYHWPECIEDGERIRGRDVTVETLIELHAGERFARVTVELDNQCLDHRLRAWFPLPIPAMSSTAECAFAVVERGLTAEGGPTEVGIPTFPSRRFVGAGGLTIAHEGLVEYELVDVHEGGRASPRSHAVALDRLPVPWPDGEPRAARGSDHRDERLAGARPPHVAVCDRAR